MRYQIRVDLKKNSFNDFFFKKRERDYFLLKIHSQEKNKLNNKLQLYGDVHWCIVLHLGVQCCFLSAANMPSAPSSDENPTPAMACGN